MIYTVIYIGFEGGSLLKNLPNHVCAHDSTHVAAELGDKKVEVAWLSCCGLGLNSKFFFCLFFLGGGGSLDGGQLAG